MKYSVIAIEREYASGGSEIGEKLAQRLGVKCYKNEVLQKAAQKIGLSAKELQDIEESMSGSFLYGLHLLTSIPMGDNSGLTTAQKLAVAEVEIVRELAIKPCIIIGRCSAAVLKDNPKVLKVFIHGDRDFRINRAIEQYNVNSKNVESKLRQIDKRRSTYFKATAGVDWKNEDTYDIMFNSSSLGIDEIVDVLENLSK